MSNWKLFATIEVNKKLTMYDGAQKVDPLIYMLKENYCIVLKCYLRLIK